MNVTARKAFTLTELLVVIAILGLLAALIVPVAGHSIAKARDVQCRNNLRAMGQHAMLYVADNRGVFFPAFEGMGSESWDFCTVRVGREITKTPGFLWGGDDVSVVLQCPTFTGSDNAGGDPYTGYNYNTSYIGNPDSPAKLSQIRNPSNTALFGEGEYENGANKYMRSPLANPASAEDSSFSGRHAGTQGMRHLGHTNICFVDGHVGIVDTLYGSAVENGLGFFSEDNSMYDID